MTIRKTLSRIDLQITHGDVSVLTLTRKNQESIFIQPDKNIDPNMTVAELFANGDIEIVVHRIKSGSAAISISAPSELKVVRSELLDK